jgi:transcriptional regulator with XRE-family HTH domain
LGERKQFANFIRILNFDSKMSLLSSNLRHLRKKKGLTQAQLAEKIGIKRSALGAYEEGRAEPKLTTLQAFAEFFELNIDDIFRVDLTRNRPAPPDIKGNKLRVLSVTVDQNENEQIPLVPIKAAAGYAGGYGDAEYIGNLPQFSMPFPELAREKTYRIFQTEGDSMLPVPGGAYVITEYLSDWSAVRSDECYVVLTRDGGMVFKRVINRLDSDEELLLKSDNPAYQPYTVKADNLLEIWKVLGFVSFDLPDPHANSTGINELRQAIGAIKKDLSALKPAN